MARDESTWSALLPESAVSTRQPRNTARKAAIEVRMSGSSSTTSTVGAPAPAAGLDLRSTVDCTGTGFAPEHKTHRLLATGRRTDAGWRHGAGGGPSRRASPAQRAPAILPKHPYT